MSKALERPEKVTKKKWLPKDQYKKLLARENREWEKHINPQEV